MDVRVLTYGYNERELLPLKLAWCEHHGVRLVYFDNESTDGSREWAIDHGVFAGDLLTGGAFDIDAIIQEVDRYRRSSHYDWTVLAGVDLFLSGLGGQRLVDYLARRSELEPGVDGSHYRTLASTDFTTPAESARCIHETPASGAFTDLVDLLRELGSSP
jgi:hypothetical protein